MAGRYWETETPVEVKSDNSILRFYPKAGKFQICSVWYNKEGQPNIGKVVVLDYEDMQTHPEVLGLLKKVAEDWSVGIPQKSEGQKN